MIDEFSNLVTAVPDVGSEAAVAASHHGQMLSKKQVLKHLVKASCVAVKVFSRIDWLNRLSQPSMLMATALKS
jgi:hypothetical protein